LFLSIINDRAKADCRKPIAIKSMHHKLPVRHLIRQSGRLLLFFVLVSLIVGTTNELTVHAILSRALITLILFSLTFFANIGVLIFYDSRRESSTEKIGTKTFITGYIFAVIIFAVFHASDKYLKVRGIYLTPPDQNVLKQMEGWRVYVFVPYVSLIIYSFVYLVQNFIVHQYEKNRIEMELLKLQSINTETINQLLRQQIQPHFLFNALNILKSLIKKYPHTAEAYLMRLSDFLRASVVRNNSAMATVKEELKLCDDYMEMQRIRFGEALEYVVEIEDADDCMKDMVPFFALQALLENAIKHNELTKLYPLKIAIKQQDDYIFVTNNRQSKKTIEKSTGSGLANLRERYKMLSGDDIVIEDNESYFSVGVKILDHEHHHN
jgi:two-component system LytT family sensor kinase